MFTQDRILYSVLRILLMVEGYAFVAKHLQKKPIASAKQKLTTVTSGGGFLPTALPHGHSSTWVSCDILQERISFMKL